MNWIVTICRNCLDLTRRAVPTLLNQDIGDVQLLLINNACSDGTAAYVRWLRWGGSPITMISYPEPQSVAACWNAALRIVLAKNDYCLVVNNDIELRPDAYRHLVADGGVFVTGVGVGTREQMNAEWNPDPAQNRPSPDYSCFLIRSSAFKAVPFDEAFVGAYGEDAAHHLGLHRAGIPAYTIGIPFYHVASGTLKGASDEEKRRIQKSADLNRALFKQRHGVEIGSPGYYALFE